jgi:hypothetical protein
MTHGKLIAGGTALAVALGGGVAMAAAPKTTTIKEKSGTVYSINRFVQSKLRWSKDTYTVAHGGTLHIVANKLGEGPHTFTVVRKKDLPTTNKAINNCLAPGHICLKLAIAHGADPSSQGPPKFQFLENGKGQNTPPNVDRPGDSAAIGFTPAQKAVDLKVTAKKGTTLHFMCLVHPWMQATVKVG